MEVLVKNSTIMGKITDQGKMGEGIFWHDGFPCIFPIAFLVMTLNLKSSRLINLYIWKVIAGKGSKLDRVEPKCSVASQCGGCQLQHQSQLSQVSFKSNLLVSRLSRFVDLSNVQIEPMLSGDRQWATRNKMQFAFGIGADGLEIGLYAPRSHRVVNLDYCDIMSKSMNQVLAAIRSWHSQAQVPVFNEMTGDGILRHVTLRHSYVSGELMVILTVSTSFDMDSFIDAVRQVEGVTSVFVSYQADPKNDQALGDEVVHKWGRQNIQDVVCGTICQVSPKHLCKPMPCW